jgi:phosphohistidine phosphatase SixA
MLFLVRHAHSDYSPDETRSLSESGRQAARRVAVVESAGDRNVVVPSVWRDGH